jgi:hypothetical protein
MTATAQPALARLLELEQRDAVLAAALAEAARLDTGADEVGARAAAVAAFLDAAPAEADRLDAAADAAAHDAVAATAAAAAAEAAAAAAEAGRSKEAGALRRSAGLAEDSARAARAAEQRARSAAARHRDDVAAARIEVPLLEERAAALAAALAVLPRLSASAARPPAAGLPGVGEWRSRARAGLLVVHGSLARERESLLREAAETAATVAEGIVPGPSVGVVRAQLERALT